MSSAPFDPLVFQKTHDYLTAKDPNGQYANPVPETINDWPSAVDPPSPGRRKIGPVERSVRRDLRRLGKLEDGARGTLAQMALRLAAAYDSYAGSDLAKLARVNQELRATLAAVVESGDEDDDEGAGLPTAAWDAPDSGAADTGRPGRGDRPGAS